jgi:RNA polymerase sigma-70 factor (ECF subfamily)
MSITTEDPTLSADGVLVVAHLAGDPEAFATLYRRHYRRVVEFLVARGCAHAAAEDFAQETMVRAYVYLHSFDPSRRLLPYLLTIATRLAGTEATRRAGEVLVGEPADEAGADPTEACAEWAAVRQALETIPQRQRHALVARYLEDRPPAEVAAAFGLSRGAFEQLLWRARKSLAKAYGAPSLRERAGLALLPVALRLRRLVLGVDARVSSAAQNAMPIAANVAAVGTAFVIGGAMSIGQHAEAGVTPPAAAPTARLAPLPEVARAVPDAAAPARRAAAPAKKVRPTDVKAPLEPALVAPTPAPTAAPPDEPDPADPGPSTTGRDVSVPGAPAAPGPGPGSGAEPDSPVVGPETDPTDTDGDGGTQEGTGVAVTSPGGVPAEPEAHASADSDIDDPGVDAGTSSETGNDLTDFGVGVGVNGTEAYMCKYDPVGIVCQK